MSKCCGNRVDLSLREYQDLIEQVNLFKAAKEGGSVKIIQVVLPENPYSSIYTTTGVEYLEVKYLEEYIKNYDRDVYLALLSCREDLRIYIEKVTKLRSIWGFLKYKFLGVDT